MPGAVTAIALGTALLLAGLGFDSPSLLVPGIGFLGLALVAVAWVELARPRHLVRDRAPQRMVEGEPYPLRLEARGARLPPPGGSLSDPVLEQAIGVGPGWRGAYEVTVTISGRGRRVLGPARLELRDPLGLWTRTLCSSDAGELLVLPRVEPVVASGAGAGRGRARMPGIDDGAALSGLDARAIEPEVDGLRPYREGSPASRIHWPAVARTGELIERRLVAGGESAPLVILDAFNPAGDEALDAAVRAAASLCVRLAGSGGCAALLPGDRRTTEVEPDLRAWPALHARLALVQAAARPAAATRGLRSGAVFWVTAAARPRLPQALRGDGRAARYLVAPAGAEPAGVGSVRFTVAGCEGHALGARRRLAGAA
jgi:uncharacterized protein (DUF58 family)